MKRFISSLCALSILFACTQEEPAPIRVESIELDSEELELIEGNSISLVATILPEDAENQNVIWSSSNKAVASVKDGEVTAVSVGEATITAKSEDGGKKATCVVTVNPKHIPVSAISLDKTEVAMNPDDNVMLTATIAPENASNKSVLWSSSDESIATVKDGEVTALKVGEVVITATSEDGGKKATCKVVVSAKHIPVSSVTLDKEEVSLVLEDKMTLTATVTPDNASNKTILWTSSDESIATVKDGEVTALKVGEAVITAKSADGDKKANCKVTVNAKPVPVTGVSLNKQKARVFINDELTLTATVAPEDATNKTLVWTTSNALVATVKNGVVKGISVGEADITVKTEDGNHSATCKVSVTEESQTQTKGPLTLDLGIVTSTTATFNGVLDIDMLGEYDMNAGGVGFIYAPADQPLNIVTSAKVQISEVDSQGKFSHTLTGLKYNSKYHYAIFVYKNTICQYGETQVFETVPVNMELSVKDITQTRATISGRLTLPENDKELEVGVLCSTSSDMTIATEGVKKAVVTDIMDADGGFSHRAERLLFDNTHYYRYYVKQGDTYTYGSVQDFKTETVSGRISVSDITQTRATFNGRLELTEDDLIEVGVLYSQKSDLTVGTSGVIKQKLTPDSSGSILHNAEGLQNATTYNYCYYAYQNGKYIYGETKTFTTQSVKVSLSVNHITQTTATFDGAVELTEKGLIEVGVLCSTGDNLTAGASGVIKKKLTTDSSGNVSGKVENLQFNTPYNYCYYACQNGKYVYGETKTFTTSPVKVTLSVNHTTQTTATFDGTAKLTEYGRIEVGILCSTGDDLTAGASGVIMKTLTTDSSGNVSGKVENLQFNTPYNYCYYVCQNGKYTYGNVQTFRTEKVPVTIEVDSIDKNVVTFKGNVQFSEAGVIEIGVQYYPKSTTSQSAGIQTKTITEISENGDFIVEISGLLSDTEYYWQYYLLQNGVTIVGLPQTFEIADLYNVQSDLNMLSASDLSSSASANCYIISESGLYKFKTVKGNSSESVGCVASASILWETFGTSTVPDYLELIDGVCYKDGYIAFQTADTFKEGNAVIAAKDASGNILWSWHIWLTDQPKAHVYFTHNNAGTMMDRNLGATSATPGDVGALGLLYQWGRKDPFLGSSSIGSSTLAKSTITWPSTVDSNSSNGTIEYATAHPTTFITRNGNNSDWYYTGDYSTDNTRWTTSDKTKSIYDPCPAGWRVPDGGSNGVWSKALGSSERFTDKSLYNSSNEGMNFSGKFGSASTIWYPASGYRYSRDGSLDDVGSSGHCWSASPNSKYAYSLDFDFSGYVVPLAGNFRAYGLSVRCLKE